MRIVLGLAAVLLLIPRTSLAQTVASVTDVPRVFVDVSLLGTASSLARGREFTSQFITFGEVGSFRATYATPSRSSRFPRDLGGGFMLTRSVGIGVSYSRTASENVAGLAATIPDPTFLSTPASDTGVTDERLSRQEASTHVFGAFVPVRTNRVQLRVFGGPSFFSYKADMVQDVLYAQASDPVTPRNTITINGFTSREAKGSSVGFHIGGDVAYFFTKVLGVAGGVRFSRGTVTVDEEPLSELSQEIRVGGTLVFLGVRFRFGG